MSELQALQRLKFDPSPVAAAPGGAPEFAWLPLSEIYIDPAYQREILKSGRNNIRTMIAHFSWRRFGVLDVARRAPGRYAIIDGQHRATAALCHGGIATVPCLIQQGDVAAEARAFSAINAAVTRINALQSFRAAVAGKDEEAVRITAVCAEAGVTIAPHPREKNRPGETQALAAIRQCLLRDGPKALATALIVLRAADPQSGLPGPLVKALCHLAPRHHEWHRDAAKVGALLARGGDFAKLLAKANARKQQRGGTEWRNAAEIAEAQIAVPDIPNLSRLMAGR